MKVAWRLPADEADSHNSPVFTVSTVDPNVSGRTVSSDLLARHPRGSRSTVREGYDASDLHLKVARSLSFATHRTIPNTRAGANADTPDGLPVWMIWNPVRAAAPAGRRSEEHEHVDHVVSRRCLTDKAPRIGTMAEGMRADDNLS